MTDKNPRPPNSPDKYDFTNQWNMSEYLNLEVDQWPDNEADSFVSGHTLISNYQDNQANDQVGEFGGGIRGTESHEGSSSRDYHSNEREKNEIGDRVAFRTKSEVEVLDDGFKWRKYGKKMVKNSPNPRNYYRCSVDGCTVKKRVERDKDDPSYVITTYEGTHTHPNSHQVENVKEDLQDSWATEPPLGSS